MKLPQNMLKKLHQGYAIAAEIPTEEPQMRAFVVVLPKYPSREENPDAWIQVAKFLPRIRDASFIRGYQVRLVVHHEKYAAPEYGLDYDIVLNDITTRVRSTVFIEKAQEDGLAQLLEEWGIEIENLQETRFCESSLVSVIANRLIDTYSQNPSAHPHLWLS